MDRYLSDQHSTVIFLLQERLQFIEEQLDDYASRKEIQEKLYKRQEKRKWIKRKKERQKREEEELIIHREKLHELIDNERSIHKHQELNREKVSKIFFLSKEIWLLSYVNR